METRAPPEPPVITVGPRSSCEINAARVSACMVDSDSPVKQTSDSPQFGRSQISTWLPCSASASASSRIPPSSLLKRPPGVITHGRPSPINS